MGHTGNGPHGSSNGGEWHLMAARCRLCGERKITETDCNVCEECIEQLRELQAENEQLRSDIAGLSDQVLIGEQEIERLREFLECELCETRDDTVRICVSCYNRLYAKNERLTYERDEAREAAAIIWDGGISTTEALDRWPWLDK